MVYSLQVLTLANILGLVVVLATLVLQVLSLLVAVEPQQPERALGVRKMPGDGYAHMFEFEFWRGRWVIGP